MIPTLKLNSGNVLPKIGLGTWMMGGDMHRNPANNDNRDIEAIKYALDSGITWIRTAQNYADGHTLKLISQAIRGRSRNSFQICLSIFEGVGVDTKSIEKNIRKSAKDLGVDYVDIAIVGGLNPEVSIKEIAKGLLNLKNIGLAKDIGVGNYRLAELERLVEYCGGDLAYNELQYSLVVREPLYFDILKYMHTNNLVLGAYRPLHLGQLTGSGIGLLDDLSIKYSKTAAELSLKWLVSQDGVMTMPKASNKEHIDAIANLFSWDMSQEDLSLLTSSFPITVRRGDCIPPVSRFTE